MTNIEAARQASGKTIAVVEGKLNKANSKRTAEECPSEINLLKRLIALLIQKISVNIKKKREYGYYLF